MFQRKNENLGEGNMVHTSLFALSGDPITNGHLEIITKASQRSDKTLVAILNNEQKAGKYLFSLKEREEMATRAIQELGLKNVTVISTNQKTLLVDLYLKHNCSILFRGIRNEVDKRYEEEQMALNKLILPSLQVGYLEAGEATKLISSSMVKSFVQYHLDISAYVPMFVKQKLEHKLNGQFKIAITGEMATGKSWVTDNLVKYLTLQGYYVKAIKLDNLIREIYDEDTPGSDKLREDLVNLTQDKKVLNADEKTVNRKVLAEFMFHPETGSYLREKVEELTKPLLQMKYREALAGCKGIVLFEWAQLAEMQMGGWTNYNAIVVQSPDRDKFCEARGLSKKEIEDRAKTQWSAETKFNALRGEAIQAKMKNSFLKLYNNVMGSEGDLNLKELGNRIISYYEIYY